MDSVAGHFTRQDQASIMTLKSYIFSNYDSNRSEMKVITSFFPPRTLRFFQMNLCCSGSPMKINKKLNQQVLIGQMTTRRKSHTECMQLSCCICVASIYLFIYFLCQCNLHTCQTCSFCFRPCSLGYHLCCKVYPSPPATLNGTSIRRIATSYSPFKCRSLALLAC